MCCSFRELQLKAALFASLPWVMCCVLLPDRKALGRQQGVATAAAAQRTERFLVQLLVPVWLREGKERILQGLGDGQEEEETFTLSRCCYSCPSGRELLPILLLE